MKPIALVLGSGGVRGFSFLGVLEVLEAERIPIGCVVGASMGAILGAAYCAGVPLATVRAKAMLWRRRDFGAFSFRAAGLLSHAPLMKMVASLIGVERFEQLQIPLRVVCTDLQKGCEVRYEEGELVPPVVGSSLAAGIFEPVLHGERYLIDGGYSNPVPAKHAPVGMPVVYIDPSALPDRPIDLPPAGKCSLAKKPRVIWTQALKGMDIALFNLAQAANNGVTGLRVQPPLGDIQFHDFSRAGEAIRAGSLAMREAILRLPTEGKDISN